MKGCEYGPRVVSPQCFSLFEQNATAHFIGKTNLYLLGSNTLAYEGQEQKLRSKIYIIGPNLDSVLTKISPSNLYK
jgi:hypothetical protein